MVGTARSRQRREESVLAAHRPRTLNIPEIKAIEDRVFLVRSYQTRFDPLERTLKEVLHDRFVVVTGRDVTMGYFLDGICGEMRGCIFGVVVLGGLKATRHVGSRPRTEPKLNVGFEYCLLKGMNKPVLVLLAAEDRIDLGAQFSDVEAETYNKIWMRGKRLRLQLEKITEKFLHDLPRTRYGMWARTFDNIPSRDRKEAAKALRRVMLDSEDRT